MALFVNVHGVAGLAPAARNGLGCLLRILVITAEHGGAAHQQLAAVRQAYFGAAHRPPHALEAYLAATVGGDVTRFGAGIVLPQLDTDGVD